MPRAQLSEQQIIALLDEYLDVEFSFIRSEVPASQIAGLPREQQDFILNLSKRVAATNIELAYQLASNAVRALEAMDEHMVEAWAMTATDNYDRKGLYPAMTVIRELDNYIHTAHEHACGSVFEEQASILLPFLHGLSGRKLKLQATDNSWTDTETIFLPPIMALMPEAKQNFSLYKATVAHHWAQIHFGTFHIDLDMLAQRHVDEPDFLHKFHALETLRLDACIQRELPGLRREMQSLEKMLNQRPPHADWLAVQAELSQRNKTAHHTLELIDRIDISILPDSCCYQGLINPHGVAETRHKRIEKEKAYFKVALSEIAKEMLGEPEPAADNDATLQPAPAEFELKPKHESDDVFTQDSVELQLEGKPMPTPDHVQELISSIFVDFGEIPPEYLTAAGPGEYDISRYEDSKLNPEDVWQGTYHEEGAELYNEWNFQRQHYHKNWCVLRELDVQPKYDSFVADTLDKYRGQLKSLRHTFEILRGEDKLLKKQPYGDDIDINAFVDALADVKSGMEMPEQLFTKMHKEERNVAVLLMVDMSGSTKGWINQAEREALVLLAEALEILGDRYAIYGFSGVTRKRCELFRIKSFDDEYDSEIRARISNMEPQDYTRMGVFIRHGTRLFSEVEASTKLMITLSDGKPDDYDTYRGEYGIEDTRQALYEAKREGIHSFCITIDEQARDYLPHMYGAANYAVIDEVSQLPLKVSDIYRRLTS
jgi:nitric oxide reductase NorD protein